MDASTEKPLKEVDPNIYINDHNWINYILAYQPNQQPILMLTRDNS